MGHRAIARRSGQLATLFFTVRGRAAEGGEEVTVGLFSARTCVSGTRRSVKEAWINKMEFLYLAGPRCACTVESPLSVGIGGFVAARGSPRNEWMHHDERRTHTKHSSLRHTAVFSVSSRCLAPMSLWLTFKTNRIERYDPINRSLFCRKVSVKYRVDPRGDRDMAEGCPLLKKIGGRKYVPVGLHLGRFTGASCGGC